MIAEGSLVMFPGNSPMFVRDSRLHDELLTGKFKYACQVFADKSPYQCALNVKGQVMSRFVDLICTERRLSATRRILHWRSFVRRLSFGLRVLVHHLDRHVAVARVDQQPGAVNSVNLPVRTLLFEPGQPPGSDKPLPDVLIRAAILAAGGGRCDHADQQGHYAARKQFFHVRFLVSIAVPSGQLSAIKPKHSFLNLGPLAYFDEVLARFSEVRPG